MIDILRGFTELISHGIIHRGLKLTNIMLTDKGYKLAGINYYYIEIVD